MTQRLALALALCAVLAPSALADDISDFTDALGQAATGAIVARAYIEACDKHAPDGQQGRRDALAGWSHRVNLAGYERFLDAAYAVINTLEAELEDNRARAQALVDADVAENPAVCSDLRATLEGNAMFDIAPPIRYLLRNAEDFGVVVPEAPAASANQDEAVVPLIALSAQLEDKMDEIGSKSGAQEDRNLRSAREEHAEAWLKQRPTLAVFGRIVTDNGLREWRGDQQSSFLLTCRSFASDDQESAMARDLGENRVVVGDIRWVRDLRQGGELSLDDCRVLADAGDSFELLGPADDSAGLMLRPLDYDEAFAGPGQGIAPDAVDRVLYDADFTNRLDGFGNGYTQRDEDIYVLLRDGTAYRHKWNFAFTDLNLDLSRLREPERWFTWQDRRGEVTLIQSGGPDQGAEIDVSDARRLTPAPKGLRLEATYYYLNIGMGGGRSDREYVFAADGQVQYSRSGFVAGAFGTSYIIVAGGDEDISTAAYDFDGFTLLVDGPERQERHFFALIDGQDAGRPDEILINGQVHWLKQDE